jgi:hypothetical protein
MNTFEKADKLNQERVFDSLNEGEILLLERQKTARESVKLFFGMIQEVKNSKDSGLFIPAIGLKCANRTSCYDLIYDIQKRIVYAIDTDDANYVCKAHVNCN